MAYTHPRSFGFLLCPCGYSLILFQISKFYSPKYLMAHQLKYLKNHLDFVFIVGEGGLYAAQVRLCRLSFVSGWRRGIMRTAMEIAHETHKKICVICGFFFFIVSGRELVVMTGWYLFLLCWILPFKLFDTKEHKQFNTYFFKRGWLSFLKCGKKMLPGKTGDD